MAGTVTRRPLPALIALLALLALTAIVWLRVLNRDDKAGASSCPTPTPTPTPSIRPNLPNPASVDVLVLNATKRNGIAAAVRRTLLAAGFSSSKPAANDTSKRKVAGVAEIRFGPAGKNGAALLHYYLPGATMVGSGRITTPVVTLALGPQYTTLATDAAVKAAMVKARQATSSPPPSSARPGPTTGSSTGKATGSASPSATRTC